MICPKCGVEIDDRAKFCPECGSSLRPDTEEVYVPMRETQSAPFYRAPIVNRSIPVAIILSIVTCGIYMLYWLYCIVNDLNTASDEQNDVSAGLVVLLGIVTCGIYMLYWYYRAGQKVNRMNSFSGKPADSSLSILYLLLSLFGFSIISLALIQNELNQVAGL